MEGKSQAATASTTQQEVDDYVAKEAAGWQDAPFMNMSVGGTAINRMLVEEMKIYHLSK